MVTKSNAQRHGMVLWDKVFNEVAKEYEGQVEWVCISIRLFLLRISSTGAATVHLHLLRWATGYEEKQAPIFARSSASIDSLQKPNSVAPHAHLYIQSKSFHKYEKLANHQPFCLQDKMLVDAMTVRMVNKPESMDTIVATNRT